MLSVSETGTVVANKQSVEVLRDEFAVPGKHSLARGSLCSQSLGHRGSIFDSDDGNTDPGFKYTNLNATDKYNDD